MIFLFTTKDCPKCKAVKETFKALGKKFKEKDVATEDGLVDYHYYNNNNHIGLPMIIEVNDNEEYVKDLSKDFGE